MRLFKRFLLGVVLVSAFGSIAKAADLVSTTTIRNAGGTFGGTYSSVFSNASDGTGEALVTKITASGLAGTPTRLKITKLKWATYGMNVLVLFDGTAKSTATILSGNGELSEKDGFVLQDPWVTGHNGNILFSTQGHTTGDGYNIYMETKAVQ